MGGAFTPNIFTPNGDGNNDYFQIFPSHGTSYTDFSVMIKSKLGKKVFESNDPSFKWDGMYKGKAVAEDIYNVCMEANVTRAYGIDSMGIEVTRSSTKFMHTDGPVTLHRMRQGKYNGDCVLDFSYCQWGSQWDGSAYDASLPSNEFCY